MTYNLGLAFQAIALYLIGYACGYFSTKLFELISIYKKQKLDREMPFPELGSYPDVSNLEAKPVDVSNLEARDIHIGLVSEPLIAVNAYREYMRTCMHDDNTIVYIDGKGE